MSKLKIQISQINTSVGDLEGNLEKILHQYKLANEANCDLVIFPEMAICGYPCDDLWNKKYFIKAAEEKLLEICKVSRKYNCAILVGAPTSDIERKKTVLRNSAVLIESGEIKKIINKKNLPNFSVFDEARYFTPDKYVSNIEFRGQTLTILICEDLWDSKNLFLLKEQIFDSAIILNSSPYAQTKHQERLKICENFTTTLNKGLIYVNQVGGQDSLVFDGASFIMNSDGKITLQMKEFEEDSAIIEFEKCGPKHQNKIIRNGSTSDDHPNFMSNNSTAEKNYNACILGLHDYIKKNSFEKIMLGMSGGIDSALVAAIAVDALGAKNVSLYALPSRFNSEESMSDAVTCAKNLGLKLGVISIEMMFEAAIHTMPNLSDLAKENLQSRLRGNILMSLSNSSGALLLSTGNKSELACGYATIYGDMCGAFNPIKDLYKMQVYELAKLKSDVIPQNILTKAPSAELRPDQKDSDSLPDYKILDGILFSLIEEEKSIAEIAEKFDESLVKKIAKLLYSSEYKRKQSVMGVKISNMSFDRERRYPTTNKFTQ
jgi:NAD+ synthase